MLVRYCSIARKEEEVTGSCQSQALATKTQQQQSKDAAAKLRAMLERNQEFLNNISLSPYKTVEFQGIDPISQKNR
ncbi:MAG: hypothetical protein E6R05_00315 [Candidatus Moraniibacteriota bacterium]|nr:MAG: hypothetical protein E6R05_00315 [Candidatus Moranbacteria bacterium]HAJ90415.1 hypothetical protein [Rhodospirillaceae bacterium]